MLPVSGFQRRGAGEERLGSAQHGSAELGSARSPPAAPASGIAARRNELIPRTEPKAFGEGLSVLS